MVQSLELEMDASCSSLTHARTLQHKFTPFVAGWLERHSDQSSLRLSKMWVLLSPPALHFQLLSTESPQQNSHCFLQDWDS